MHLVLHALQSGIGREITSVDSDLGTPLRIIAVPFFRSDGLRGNVLEALSDKQPLGARLSGTGKDVRQTLSVRFLHQRLP